MPDGKRSSLPPDGETDGVNGFYDEELQNATGLRRKVPLNQNSRSFNSLSDRLLKAMVANEIKKTLNGEDNKKLVAHHRPVLHAESDGSDSDMVVLGVVLSPKQTQNEEISRAIDMLRKNGVRCVSFSIKDSMQGSEKKDEGNVDPENGSSPCNDELLKTLIAQQENENTSPSTDQDQNELSPGPKKVSSPTVSTTSDYASPPSKESVTKEADDVVLNLESDASCTSTTNPLQNTASAVVEDYAVKAPARVRVKKTTRRRATRRPRSKAQAVLPPALSPSPPILFPQVLEPPSHPENGTTLEESKVDETDEKPKVDETALRRKRRRKRMYPYVSRRKPRSKRKKVSSQVKDERIISEDMKPSLPPDIRPQPIAQSLLEERKLESPVDKTIKDEVDPYEFDDDDIEAAANNTFKTPAGRKCGPKKRSCKSMPSIPCPKRKNSKRSPRKRLTFPKTRAISPDITDHGSSITRRLREPVGPKPIVESGKSISAEKCTVTAENCVQPISTSPAKPDPEVLPRTEEIPEDDKLVLSQNDHTKQSESLQDTNCDDEPPANANNATDKDIQDNTKAGSSKASEETLVQAKPTKTTEAETKPRVNEFVVPAPPDDSLHDAPDSMQLRRSSFYSSISRNVRTNLEKYLDGRPPDLKPVKRSKKIKNGFLLHHGDNFPEDPEAPYRLHLATQVLLKLNKRRVKCKPKEDKGKSLLSYLKLQPKRVSRVGKNKASSEVSEVSASKETTSVFSGEWTVPRKYVCNICGQVENEFWDMVMHKGEVHPGIVVTHVELSHDPPEGFRRPPSPRVNTTCLVPPPCTKCGSSFSTYPDLHRHIFECAGNASVLDEGTSSKVAAKIKKKKRKRGFNKRRISNLPKKNANKNPATAKTGEITKRRNSEVFKCEFCTREFKTEGWLKNHVSLSHSLPISIPLNKLSLPSRASFSSSRRFAAHLGKSNKQLGRES